MLIKLCQQGQHVGRIVIGIDQAQVQAFGLDHGGHAGTGGRRYTDCAMRAPNTVEPTVGRLLFAPSTNPARGAR